MNMSRNDHLSVDYHDDDTGRQTCVIVMYFVVIIANIVTMSDQGQAILKTFRSLCQACPHDNDPPD